MTHSTERVTSPQRGEGKVESQPGRLQRMRERLGKLSWQHWAVLLVFTSGAIGFTATTALLKLPKDPNCLRVFWPFASAATRLYCAQLEAEEGTVDSLLKAIQLVEALPKDHPLRAEIDRNVEAWAVQILDLAEEDFQQGNLEKAIATARQIPATVKAAGLSAERIAAWQSIWQEGETIFAEVERQLRESEWNQAFREAVKLLNLDNKYWATSKYDEIVGKIMLAQEESKKLDRAYAVLRRGGADNWFQAIAEAEKISPDSYAYQEAQNIIAQAKDKLVDYAQTLIEGRNWQALSDIAARMPASLGLSQEVQGWQTLASAGSDADLGTVDSLQAAIATAGQIDSNSPLYPEVQSLVERWQLEIEDVAHLEKAREFAQAESVQGWQSAIAQAGLIPPSHPRYQEARGKISDWNRQIQLVEDQPLLDKARELARNGTIPALQEAIAQANLIGPNRALSAEAKRQVRQWRTRIEVQEDQPYLDRALALADAKDYSAAITAARQIGRGRALSGDARSNIRRWQREVQAQEDLQQAYAIARAGTPGALASAMSTVRRIPSSTDAGEESALALNRWSYQLLAMAKEKANAAALSEAIKLVKLIPKESEAFGMAREQLAVWQQMLEPPAPVIETSSPPSLEF